MNTQDFKQQLREKAERKLGRLDVDIDSLDKQATRRLLEELQIHKIELEIQNEELRNSQLRLEQVNDRYIRLFNNAPVGYVILDNTGMIKQYNAAFEDMLAQKQLKLAGRGFADLLKEADARTFRARYRALFKHPAGKQAEYRLIGNEGKKYHIQITAKTHTHESSGSERRADELLLMITDITDLKSTKQDLETALNISQTRGKEVQALLKGAKAVLHQTDFKTTARTIFDICSVIIGSTSGYVALLNDAGDENEVLFLEAGGLPCTVDPSLPMPVRGLREIAYKTNNTVYDNDFMNSEWMKFMPKGHVRLVNVMFAPLVINEKTIGVIGLANKNGQFTNEDARIAHGFAKLCAIALVNSRNMDQREAAEKKNKQLIAQLQEALSNVKQLSGLLPICCHCKKIRDDRGYWKQIEQYIHEHSEAQFSHGICKECAEKYYSEYDLYED